MPDRTGIDHSWDRNSDRAHLLLAQNRNKMQCDGLRNVWCSHCANNFCLAFRFQYFFFFFSPSRFPALDLFPSLSTQSSYYWPIGTRFYLFYRDIDITRPIERNDCPAQLVSSVSRWNDTSDPTCLARPFHSASIQRSRNATLAFTNIRARKCIGWVTGERQKRRDYSRGLEKHRACLILLDFFNNGAFHFQPISVKKRWILMIQGLETEKVSNKNKINRKENILVLNLTLFYIIKLSIFFMHNKIYPEILKSFYDEETKKKINLYLWTNCTMHHFQR